MYCKPNIFWLSPLGELEIHFNSTMKTKDQLGNMFINSTMLQLYVEPYEERYKDETFNISKFNLSWEIDSYHDNVLML